MKCIWVKWRSCNKVQILLNVCFHHNFPAEKLNFLFFHSNVPNFPFMPSYPCNPPLIYSNKSGYCKPPCNWLPYSEYEQDAMAATDWITAVFCITSFLVVCLTWFKIPELLVHFTTSTLICFEVKK